MQLKLIAATTFGLEAVARREIEKLGYEVIRTENGKVVFAGDERAVVRSNLWLRCADRILIMTDEFTAEESEELFQRVKGCPWEQMIPPDGKFTVNASTVKSKLRSEPNCQKTVKKAIVERLTESYGISRFPETGAEYTVKVTLLKDRATITVDTTGAGLNKRGYRTASVAAPVKETLAAAMVELSFWNKDRLLIDPCCGSGTIPIEAAMIGRNIAPGLSRRFAAEDWDFIDKEMWKEERKKAFEAIDSDAELKIFAGDIDKEAVAAANENAAEAGVDDAIEFSCMDIVDFLEKESVRDGGAEIVITNPPYGERIGSDKEIQHIYEALAAFMAADESRSLFMITSDRTAEEKIMGHPADRRRKLYNGRIEVCYYQFHGRRAQRRLDE